MEKKRAHLLFPDKRVSDGALRMIGRALKSTSIVRGPDDSVFFSGDIDEDYPGTRRTKLYTHSGYSPNYKGSGFKDNAIYIRAIKTDAPRYVEDELLAILPDYIDEDVLEEILYALVPMVDKKKSESQE